MKNIRPQNISIFGHFRQWIVIQNTNNENELLESQISIIYCWEIVSLNVLMCKLLPVALFLTSTELNTVVIIFGTLAVNIFRNAYST